MKSKIIIGLFCLALGACASAAKPGAMAVQVSQSTLIDSQSILYKSTATPTVTGGKETSPLWKSNVSSADFAEALKQSLSANTILASENARYKLAASLIELKQPLIGMSMTVISRVKYVLMDAADDSVIWDKEITAPYTAKMSDAFVGSKRLQLANEGAIRENIKQLVDSLVVEAKINAKLQPAVKPVSTLIPAKTFG
jgi:hypothetical protein